LVGLILIAGRGGAKTCGDDGVSSVFVFFDSDCALYGAFWYFPMMSELA
jgi:hypothetical protein